MKPEESLWIYCVYNVPYLWGCQGYWCKSPVESNALLTPECLCLAPPSQSSTHSALATDRSPEPHPSGSRRRVRVWGAGSGIITADTPSDWQSSCSITCIQFGNNMSLVNFIISYIISRLSAVDLYSAIKIFPALKHASSWSYNINDFGLYHQSSLGVNSDEDLLWTGRDASVPQRNRLCYSVSHMHWSTGIGVWTWKEKWPDSQSDRESHWSHDSFSKC